MKLKKTHNTICVFHAELVARYVLYVPPNPNYLLSENKSNSSDNKINNANLNKRIKYYINDFRHVFCVI